jgi:hypothetical protein
MPAVGKKLHHQVPQFYLKAWGEDARAVENAYVFCLQNGKIRLSPSRIASGPNKATRM